MYKIKRSSIGNYLEPTYGNPLIPDIDVRYPPIYNKTLKTWRYRDTTFNDNTGKIDNFYGNRTHQTPEEHYGLSKKKLIEIFNESYKPYLGYRRDVFGLGSHFGNIGEKDFKKVMPDYKNFFTDIPSYNLSGYGGYLEKGFTKPPSYYKEDEKEQIKKENARFDKIASDYKEYKLRPEVIDAEREAEKLQRRTERETRNPDPRVWKDLPKNEPQVWENIKKSINKSFGSFIPEMTNISGSSNRNEYQTAPPNLTPSEEGRFYKYAKQYPNNRYPSGGPEVIISETEPKNYFGHGAFYTNDKGVYFNNFNTPQQFPYLDYSGEMPQGSNIPIIAPAAIQAQKMAAQEGSYSPAQIASKIKEGEEQQRIIDTTENVPELAKLAPLERLAKVQEAMPTTQVPNAFGSYGTGSYRAPSLELAERLYVPKNQMPTQQSMPKAQQSMSQYSTNPIMSAHRAQQQYMGLLPQMHNNSPSGNPLDALVPHYIRAMNEMAENQPERTRYVPIRSRKNRYQNILRHLNPNMYGFNEYPEGEI